MRHSSPYYSKNTKCCGSEWRCYRYFKASYEPKCPLQRGKTQFSFDWQAVMRTASLASEAGLKIRKIRGPSAFERVIGGRRQCGNRSWCARDMPKVGLELSSHSPTHFPPYAFRGILIPRHIPSADCGTHIRAYSHTSISIGEAKSRPISDTWSSAGRDLALEKSSSPLL